MKWITRVTGVVVVNAVFLALEVQSLINPVTFLFTCDVCSDELEENQRAAGLVSSQELQSRYAFFGVS